MKDTVEVDQNKFTWSCPNCAARNFANPTVLNAPFGEVTCSVCGLQFVVADPMDSTRYTVQLVSPLILLIFMLVMVIWLAWEVWS